MIVVLWLIFATCSAVIASSKNRSGFGWFLLGILFGPFALLTVGFMAPLAPRPIFQSPPAQPSQPISQPMNRTIPYAELADRSDEGRRPMSASPGMKPASKFATDLLRVALGIGLVLLIGAVLKPCVMPDQRPVAQRYPAPAVPSEPLERVEPPKAKSVFLEGVESGREETDCVQPYWGNLEPVPEGQCNSPLKYQRGDPRFKEYVAGYTFALGMAACSQHSIDAGRGPLSDRAASECANKGERAAGRRARPYTERPSRSPTGRVLVLAVAEWA